MPQSPQSLDKLFRPRSIALIGASNRPTSVGCVLMKNLLEGGFNGPILPVNPKAEAICGVVPYSSVDKLPMVPDMAVICTPPGTIPELVEQLGELGCKAVIIITAGLNNDHPETGANIQASVVEIARKYNIRIMGPNCLGLVVPSLNINASFTATPALDGNIAFISQSGALCVSVLDWAMPRNIGFSYFASVGDMAEMGFADAIEWLADNDETHAIFLYVESIKDNKRFIELARKASRKKPVFAIKSGRVAEGAAAAASHTGALAGADDVYDAAFEQAGVVRLDDLENMLAMIEMLSHTESVGDENLVILTNGGGPGVLAVDRLVRNGGYLSKLSDDTIAKLDKVLPATWSRGNPVDIIGDAPGARYAEAMKILYNAPEVDDILVMYVPSGITSAVEVAEKVIAADNYYGNGNMFACWVGGKVVQPALDMFAKADIPSFASGEKGVIAFVDLYRYQKLQKFLDKAEAARAANYTPDTATARQIIAQSVKNGHDILSEHDAKEVFACYGIPVARTRVAKDPAQAEKFATEMNGAPVVIKIDSPDITHKSDVGGVALDLKTPAEVRKAAEDMVARISASHPNAKLTGFSVQEMLNKDDAHELIIGVTTDPIWGPVVLIGQGGTEVEVAKDRAIVLPPVNPVLAQNALEKTRIYNLLKGYRDRPAAKIDEINDVLCRISQMVIDLPEIAELDINPLFADDKRVVAVDGRIVVKK